MGYDKGELLSIWNGCSKPSLVALIIGLVLGLYMQKPDLSQLARFFLVVGGLGAFTTFSTFAFEMYNS